MASDYFDLPPDLPVPVDDGAARHLTGLAMPHLSLPSTLGSEVDLANLSSGLSVLFIYPLSGRPGVELPDGWNEIPGARGCTPEACAFRDSAGEIAAAGAERLFGLSSQSTEYQTEFAARVGLPYPVLSDPELELARALDLPTFTVEQQRLYRRITLILRESTIEHVFYPVFPPDQHPGEVLEWLRRRGG